MRKQTLGMMITSFRKKHGMTQLELAEKMNVTDKAVSKWERDLSCPDINSLPKLASIFGISVDELIQAQSAAQPTDHAKDLRGLIPIIFKAVSLAMGVAVIVLSIMKEVDMYSGFTMLGIGLVCVGIFLFQKNDKSNE